MDGKRKPSSVCQRVQRVSCPEKFWTLFCFFFPPMDSVSYWNDTAALPVCDFFFFFLSRNCHFCNLIRFRFWLLFLVVLWVEPRTLRRQDKRSASELRPQLRLAAEWSIWNQGEAYPSPFGTLQCELVSVRVSPWETRLYICTHLGFSPWCIWPKEDLS